MGIGNVYQSQGKYDEAIAQYERALRIYENSFGVNHVNTADTILNIGLFHKSQGRDQLARDYLSRAHLIFQSNLGMAHPFTQKAKILLKDLMNQFENKNAQKKTWRSKLKKLFK